MRACENVRIFVPRGLSDGGHLRWETITRNKTPGHINWWTNKLQTPFLERMKLAANKIANLGEQEWEGAINAELLTHGECAG